MIPFIITNHGVTVYLAGEKQTIDETPPNFEAVILAVAEQDVDEIRALINISLAITR